MLTRGLPVDNRLHRMADSQERPSKMRKLDHAENKTSMVKHDTVSEKLSVLTEEHSEKDVLSELVSKGSSGTSHVVGEQSRQLAAPQIPSGNSYEKPIAENTDKIGEIQENAKAVLSKSQAKKLKKQEQWEAGKDYRRAKRKEKTKEKKARKTEERAEEQAKIEAGELEARPANKKHAPRPEQIPVSLILDCGFNELMTDKELISLGSQLTRCYSENRAARYRTHMAISSWGGTLKSRFETVLNSNHLSWRGVRFYDGDFVNAAKHLEEVMKAEDGGKVLGALAIERARKHEGGRNGDHSEVIGESTLVPNQKPSVVYLTADSPHTLTTLSPYTSYIIGGIVDKNRHKGICYNRACSQSPEHNIQTAKLPIGEYMTMQSRSVLAVNHVVEIMLKYMETGDWGKAFLHVIPKRKEAKLKGTADKKHKSHSGDNDLSGDGEEDEDELVLPREKSAHKTALDGTR